MHRPLVRFALLALPVAALAACTANTSPDWGPDGAEGAFSSNQATLLEFEFDGELVTDSSWNDKQTIQDQLLYTIGHLNGNRSVGRLDNVEVSNVQRTADGARTKLSYHAKLPVAWGSKSNLPTKYELALPRDVSSAGQEAFTEKHKTTCAEAGAHDIDAGSMWYYYRPRRSGCTLDATEVVNATATVRKATLNTTGKYPEYHKVWEDNRLEVVAIFGKYEANAATSDAGIDGFNAFVRAMKGQLAALQLTTSPANVADAPGPAVNDVTFEAKLADGKAVKVTALLVDAITQVPPGFDARYENLSQTADIIAYNGHAGLGQNVRALARKGKWLTGKYQIFFMNGCDTFAYVDGSLAQTRAQLNADDPTGTKYMEFVTNAMPSFFSSMPKASTALINGMLSYAAPKTYDQMFANIDSSEVVLVTGEEDNVFQPGMPIGTSGGSSGGGGATPAEFKPFEESGSVARGEAKSYAYDVPAGTYAIELSGTGDADLYVRKGVAPTKTAYDCRPYQSGSSERCTITLTDAGKLHVMVNGYAAQSTFTVRGNKQ